MPSVLAIGNLQSPCEEAGTLALLQQPHVPVVSTLKRFDRGLLQVTGQSVPVDPVFSSCQSNSAMSL